MAALIATFVIAALLGLWAGFAIAGVSSDLRRGPDGSPQMRDISGRWVRLVTANQYSTLVGG